MCHSRNKLSKPLTIQVELLFRLIQLNAQDGIRSLTTERAVVAAMVQA